MPDLTMIRTRIEEGGLGVLTLSNPPVHAIGTVMLQEISSALDEFSSKGVRSIVLSSMGPNAFSAGADVKEMAKIGADPKKAREFLELGLSTFEKIESYPGFVVCAIQSLAVGGGLELALSADVRIASDRARFGFPEVTLGLIPAWGGMARLSRTVGISKAMELVLSGLLISAQEAKSLGLVHKVVPDGDEMRAAADLARRVAVKCAPSAVRAAKRALLQSVGRPLEESLEISKKEMLALLSTEDLREGIRAFLEKRPPEFPGS